MDPLNLESQNQEHSRGSTEFLNQNWRQIKQLFSELWTDIQPNKKIFLFYIDIWILHSISFISEVFLFWT